MISTPSTLMEPAGLLQAVAAPQQRALARPGWPDDEYQFPRPDLQVHASKDVKLPKIFVQFSYFENGFMRGWSIRIPSQKSQAEA